MGGLTQHDVIVAGSSALLGALIASIPVWITVSQIRRTRLKSEVTDTVDAKIGELVGGVFTNLLQLQNEVQTALRTLQTELDVQATRITEKVQSDLAIVVTDANRTMADLQQLAIRARASVSEIDMLKANTESAGIDVTRLAAEGWVNRMTRDIEKNSERRVTFLRDVNRLHALVNLATKSEQETAEFTGLLKTYQAESPEEAMRNIAIKLEIVGLDDKSSQSILQRENEKLMERNDIPPDGDDPTSISGDGSQDTPRAT